MKSVTVHKAKTTLSKLIAEVEAGEEILILRGSEPAARLVPVGSAPAVRQFGALAGQITITAAFFEPLPDDELAAWDR
ncbi:MAG: type II toxin-antitoxin system prevent-host-death family antitoxin [Gemmatimonadaceae bacterium]